MSRILGIDAIKVYQHLLREVEIQFTAKNKNPLWANHFQNKFQALGSISSSESDKDISPKLNNLFRDGKDLLTLLESNRKFKELHALYAPQVEEGNRVSASANRVGLQLPKVFGDVDDKE